ncbi:MAG TPA: DUF4288 domain-containing protein [Burkholderiales bacterium]|nr:DUF4288 domain-containing protein [Burkholderiales bacterium]
MPWFGIRSVYQFGTKPNGVNIFEERIVCIEAADEQAAHLKARAEGQQYAADNGFTRHPRQIGYEQDGDPLIDGYEVWSELFAFEGSLEEFYRRRYEQFAHGPE